MEWISVKETLPIDGQTVDCYDEEQDRHPQVEFRGGKFLGEYQELAFDTGGAYIDDIEHEIIGVTHWMPLPEPPKEEGK